MENLVQEIMHADHPLSQETLSHDRLHQFLRAAVGAADAVAQLHQSGIIHQNIRPQTLRIDLALLSVELTGVDLGQHFEPSVMALPIDSLPYIAPEQTGRIEGTIDHRADLYSLGVVLYELCSGSLPFHADDAPGWVHCHVARAPRPLSEAAPGTPSVVSEIVMRLLAKSADDRYQSARGLEHDLKRCLTELSECGRIEPFPLGARDVWDKLRGASRMYGRTEELAKLRDALTRVGRTGRVEMCALSGPSGIGKSALVRELRREDGSSRVAFLWGKFEQTKRDIPYASLGQAFQDLIRQTVASTDAELASIREQLMAALGGNGQLIVDLIPQVDLVIGKQAPIPPLPAADARNRFHLAFRSFLGVFATRERPLVLFLDDLQWADVATLELLQHIVTHPDVRNLLVIGAYREEEVDAGNPLLTMISEVAGAGVPVTTLKLGPLAQADLTELVTDLFRCERDQATHLAALLWAKAAGNPFFAVQLLGALHHEQLIRFNARKWAWQWDIAELEAKEITDDLVELVLDKFRRLPARTLDVLKIAACIGSEFSVHLLSTLDGKTPEEVREALEPALSDGLLLQRPDGYKFLHDRVLQAAYSLIPHVDRAALHLRLGWMLLERTPEAARDGLLFDIVNQLNLGAACVDAPEDRRRIAQINLRAGRKAKAASAARSAVTYLTAGLSLLPTDSWDTDYALAENLHLELADCECQSGRFDKADRLCKTLVEHARTRVDSAAAYRIQIQLATAQVDNTRAVDVALACLRMLGVDLPRDPTNEDLLAEVGWVREKLKDRAIEDLIHLPEMTDPDTIAAMETLSAVFPAAAYSSWFLAYLVVARMVRLSILHGNAPASVHGYVSLGQVLCSRFGEFHDGYRFGKLACELGQRPGFGSYNMEAFSILGGTIAGWSRPLREALDLFPTAIRIGREYGKLMHVSATLLNNVSILLAVGEPLDAVYEASVSAFEFATSAKYDFIADCAAAFKRVILSLRGDTERFGSLGIDSSNEEAFEDHLRERTIPLIQFYYYVYKLMVRYFADDYAGAHAAANAAQDLLWSGGYQIVEAEHCFYTALTSAALWAGSTEAERAPLKDKLLACEAELRKWAESCPDNFAGRHALVSAEIARIEGREHDAAVLYDQAIRASRAEGFVQIEGLASELAGRFYARRSFSILPSAYLREARSCYARWGALGKVRHLEALYPDLLAEPRRDSAPMPRAEAEQIDTLTAAKASAAISSEMVPEELLATLMRILTEHAGAQRAGLLLPSRGGLSVAAEITADHDGVRVEIPRSRSAPSATSFPLSIAHYVRRTREKLVIDDVSAEVMFAADPYLSTARPRSVLCAPIVRRGEVAGILYLENRLARGAFTPRRLALLEFLAAVSLENALLAADLARETAERTQAEKTLRQSEERLQRLVETANVVPWEAVRATGRFTYVGPQVVKMLGYPEEAWLEEGFLAAHVHPDDRESTRRHMVDPSREGDFDFRMIAADGRTVWLHNVVSARGLDGSDVLGGLVFNVTERKEAEATLKEKLEIIETQQAAILKLSSPIIEVWDGVLTMPVLGAVDERRAEQMMMVLLHEVTRTACRYTIIDLTGAEAIDTKTAEHIVRLVRAVQLLGAKSIVVGIRPEVAQTIVSMGIDLASIVTLANLREALLLCMRDQRGPRARAGGELRR